MPNQRFAFLMLAGLLWVGGWARGAEPLVHAATGIKLPEALAGMTRGEPTDFEKESGFPDMAIPYGNADTEATIYITKRVGEMAFTSPEAAVRASLEGIAEMERRGRYSELKFLSRSADGNAPGWASGAFTGKMDGNPVWSAVHATLKGNYIVKLRITTSDLKEEATTKFVAELQRVVKEAKVGR